MRITLPSLDGLSPRSDARMAASMAFICEGSNGCATMSEGSGTERPATWLSGILAPYASTCTPSSIVTVARPVRTPANSCFTCSSATFMRFVDSAYRPFKSLTSIGGSLRGPERTALRRHKRADGLAGNGALDVARSLEVKHHDRQAIVHAQRDRGRVHDLEALAEHPPVRHATESRRPRRAHRTGDV